ncbi:peroxidase isoform X2 [Dermatophagoides farinae]|uniref:peroxidase isoform X2 n=1 Tax=Dermatophagoides farinae TaxID=6954 RepID=UPI003F5F4D6C
MTFITSTAVKMRFPYQSGITFRMRSLSSTMTATIMKITVSTIMIIILLFIIGIVKSHKTLPSSMMTYNQRRISSIPYNNFNQMNNYPIKQNFMPNSNQVNNDNNNDNYYHQSQSNSNQIDNQNHHNSNQINNNQHQHHSNYDQQRWRPIPPAQQQQQDLFDRKFSKMRSNPFEKYLNNNNQITMKRWPSSPTSSITKSPFAWAEQQRQQSSSLYENDNNNRQVVHQQQHDTSSTASDNNYVMNGENNNDNDNYLANSNECALILKRFDTNDQTPPSSYGGLSFKAMMEALRGGSKEFNDEEAQNQICITYDDVNGAVEKAMRIRRYVRPNNIDNLEPPPEQIAETAEVIQEATKILAYRFELSYDEILNALPLIDMSRTIFWPHCPGHVKPINCRMERFRSYTGHCNNLENPSWGAANTAFVRYLPPVYSNGIDGYRKSVMKGRKLPHPRLVTRMVHADFDHPSTDMTILVMSWGQFLDHDLALAMPPRFFIDGHEVEVDCCRLPPGQPPHELCEPVQIPPKDPVYGPMGRKCHDFKRSIAGHRPNCALGPRVHVNILTSPIDANFVYGSTRAAAERLRTFRGGLMRTWNIFDKERMKPLLPAEDKNPDLECINRPRNLFCFIAGDIRVNEQIHLTVLHTLYVRDHNRMAIELGRINPHWDDERIYQETRHIMAATVQHIAFNEWLPIVIGDTMMNRHNLKLVEDGGYYNGYDPRSHTSPSQAFTTSAFRFGHTFIQGKVMRFDNNHKMVGQHSLRNLLRRPYIVYRPGMIDELAMGLVDTPAQNYDSFITKEVSGHLFQEEDDFAGMDLPMLNLLRAREQGVAGYNFYREWCGLKRAESFEDLIPMVGNRTAQLYSELYAHPDDIDLWSGGVSEVPMPDALVGPTFACIIARNFANIRNGDRFWYENPGMPSSFTPGQLQEIKKSSQARIICANGDNITTIQRWALRRPHEIFNPRLRCNEIPDLDLNYWRENPNNGQWMMNG